MNLEAVILGFVVVVDASYLFSFDLIFDLSAFFFLLTYSQLWELIIFSGL